jgi:hypothetical protein
VILVSPETQKTPSTLIGSNISDTGKPVIKLELDGKWHDYYDQIGDYEMNCYTLTCSINWSADQSYDPE